MKTYKFKYIITSERLSYIYADNEADAKDKLMVIMQQPSEKAVIREIEEKYVETLKEGNIGIDFNSIQEVEDVDD